MKVRYDPATALICLLSLIQLSLAIFEPLERKMQLLTVNFLHFAIIPPLQLQLIHRRSGSVCSCVIQNEASEERHGAHFEYYEIYMRVLAENPL